MTNDAQPQVATKKTPKDATEFEREQLRFFLAEDDLANTLASVNPSLAWLPDLFQMKLVKEEKQVISWLERNLTSPAAIRDVVENITFFGPDSAEQLEYRVNRQMGKLTPLLVDSWRLVVQQMRLAKPLLRPNQWFQVEPQIVRGDRTAASLERVAETLRPRLKLGKRLRLHDNPKDDPPKKPCDIVSIKFELDDRISSADVLRAWPSTEVALNDHKLLMHLSAAISAALGEATDAGVEGDDPFSVSDMDVPSVAQHEQNNYRAGFNVIVRVTADLWFRLASKSPQLAFDLAGDWHRSQYRLLRRLALFAATHPIVPAHVAADMLLETPSIELFLTGSSVEVYSLIQTRWNQFGLKKRQSILRRLREGPPLTAFREGVDINRQFDRRRFDVLGAMERGGLDIGSKGVALLAEIRARRPEWELRPPEQAGFGMWHSGGGEIRGDEGKFGGILDAELVVKAKELAANADFLDGDNWQALCTTDPDRALRGLDAAAAQGEWPSELWSQLLWFRGTYQDADTGRRIAELLLGSPADTFEKICPAASIWLEAHFLAVEQPLLWQLWDRLIDLTPIGAESSSSALTEALGSVAGQLAQVALRTLPLQSDRPELFADVIKRLDRLVDMSGEAGRLARVTLAADVSYLFERAPRWTTDKIVRLFAWSCSEAGDAWTSRKFSEIGSPELFGLTKTPFLEMFGRSNVRTDDLEIFAEWLSAIVIANRLQPTDPYPLTGQEARAALRRAGASALSHVAYRLAIETESEAPEKRADRWRGIIGPVFEEIWPIDVDLQNNLATFNLTRILLATSDAFPEAADLIIPLIKAEDFRSQTAIFSISEAPEALYALAPRKMLDLVAAVVGEAPAGSVFSLVGVLSKIRAAAPDLARTAKFQRLLACASK